MKGHLGFPCRACIVPSAPLNIRQSSLSTDCASGSIAWDEPDSTGTRPLTGYRVESLGAGGWQTLMETSSSTRTATLSWCRDTTAVRVRALNACGAGAASDSFNGASWLNNCGAHQLFTSSGTIPIPCWVNSIKVWAVGTGSTVGTGGTAGALTWKTWSVDTQYESPSISLTSSGTSVTYRGTTVTAPSGGSASSWSGGDGGRNGGSGGQSNNGANWQFLTGSIFLSSWYLGGAVAGYGDNKEERAVSPCKRVPLNATYDGGVLAAAAACGLKTTEDCSTEPAFGSGGIKVPTSPARYFAAGYGGGGFDSSYPGGAGCVIVQYLA